MVLKNPLIYVTIPLALALGLIWFRRKKNHSDSGGSKTSSNDQEKINSIENISNTNGIQEKRVDLKHSVSLPIGNTPKKFTPSPINNNDSFDFKFGKSAPIDITPHKTSPSRSDPKDKNDILNSIEENSLDSVDLPGSVDCRRRFSFTIRTSEPPIVVKASNMDVDKSPQSSFETLATSPSGSGMSMIPNKKIPEKQKINKQVSKVEADKDKENRNSNRSMTVTSPPLSLCSNKSHESGDSGKGSSPPNSEGGQTLSSLSTYDFQLLQTMVGFIVGKHGSTVRKIREECHVDIILGRHPINPKKFKLCTIQGTQEQIDKALTMIKKKLPPGVNIDRIDIELETAEWLASIANLDSSSIQLNLIGGINNDVNICSIVNGGHLFLHQPSHPTYPSLNILQNFLNQTYSTYEAPLLPSFNVGTVCIGQIDGHHYRLQILEYIQDENACLAKYLDFGGYCKVQTTELKQIRTDLISVPFQAIECLLSDIQPKDGEWSVEAVQVIHELTQFNSLQAQIAGYSECGLPEIYLYSYLSPNNVVFINEELVARGLADWYPQAPIVA